MCACERERERVCVRGRKERKRERKKGRKNEKKGRRKEIGLNGGQLGTKQKQRKSRRIYDKEYLSVPAVYCPQGAH